MLFIKRAKILSTRLYEFFERGGIDAIATSPDKLVRRTNQATFSDLRKSGIHQAFGEVVVHYAYLIAMTAVNPKADISRRHSNARYVPCVDGSELARTFFTFAALVGAAMCSAFKCGTRGRWP